MKTHNLIQQRTFEFSLSILKLSRKLREKKDYVLANQLIRSGTSIGANVEESLGGSSRKDFLAKIMIANKEARETKYWLRLINEDDPELDVGDHLNEVQQILNILSKIIITTKNNS